MFACCGAISRWKSALALARRVPVFERGTAQREERHEHSPSGRRGAGARGRRIGAEEGPLRNRRDPSARPRAGLDVRLGRAQGTARTAGAVDASRGRADLAARQPRRAGARDGRRRQLQRRMGRARRTGLRARRAQASFPYRRIGRGGDRLGGRIEGEALEGRRRGRRSLQPGRRRRRGMQRRRPDVLRRSAFGATRPPTARSRSSAACRIAS